MVPCLRIENERREHRCVASACLAWLIALTSSARFTACAIGFGNDFVITPLY